MHLKGLSTIRWEFLNLTGEVGDPISRGGHWCQMQAKSWCVEEWGFCDELL